MVESDRSPTSEHCKVHGVAAASGSSRAPEAFSVHRRRRILARRYAIFQNDQWRVTKFGLVSRSPGAPCRYQIDAEHLLQVESRLYGWPLYVVQKPWVRPDQFLEAFKVAIDAHEGRYPGQVDLALLQASFDEAMHLAEHQGWLDNSGSGSHHATLKGKARSNPKSREIATAIFSRLNQIATAALLGIIAPANTLHERQTKMIIPSRFTYPGLSEIGAKIHQRWSTMATSLSSRHLHPTVGPLNRKQVTEKTAECVMQRLNQLVDRWKMQSLAVQFLQAGGLVSLAAMVIVGISVTSLIEASVTRNSAATTALYVDSVIAPLLPDMQKSKVLGDTVIHALDETLGQGALGTRLLTFRLWSRDGTILYSKDKSQVGKRFEPSADLQAALTGKMVAEFDRIDDVESEAERMSGQPLLEIYNPVLQPWSGEVVAVSEFYEIAADFQHNLRQALVWSWLAVALVTLGFFLILSAIVFRGSRTISNQSRALKDRVGELSGLLAQNKSLRLRVQRASQRVTALNERFLRRVGADLHDGPAQLVALAALRLDSATLTDPAISAEEREREILAIKSILDDAMREIRTFCTGIVLPHIEAAELPEILALAARSHQQRTGSAVALSLSDTPTPLSPSEKICVYRFVQETLNNGFRHAGGAGQSVAQTSDDASIQIEVTDRGPGFNPAVVRPEGLGLAGLRERVESLGGRFGVKSSETGTKVWMALNTDEMGRA